MLFVKTCNQSSFVNPNLPICLQRILLPPFLELYLRVLQSKEICFLFIYSPLMIQFSAFSAFQSQRLIHVPSSSPVSSMITSFPICLLNYALFSFSLFFRLGQETVEIVECVQFTNSV